MLRAAVRDGLSPAAGWHSQADPGHRLERGLRAGVLPPSVLLPTLPLPPSPPASPRGGCRAPSTRAEGKPASGETLERGGHFQTPAHTACLFPAKESPAVPCQTWTQGQGPAPAAPSLCGLAAAPDSAPTPLGVPPSPATPTPPLAPLSPQGMSGFGAMAGQAKQLGGQLCPTTETHRAAAASSASGKGVKGTLWAELLDAQVPARAEPSLTRAFYLLLFIKSTQTGIPPTVIAMGAGVSKMTHRNEERTAATSARQLARTLAPESPREPSTLPPRGAAGPAPCTPQQAPTTPTFHTACAKVGRGRRTGKRN